MKLKALPIIMSMVICLGVSGCGGTSGGATRTETITLWVGNETGVPEFYQEKCNEFLEANPDFAYNIAVSGSDLGSIAGTILQDSSAAADIYSVAHDNVGKLAQHTDAKPISDPELLAQMNADNDSQFVDVCKSTVNEVESVYAVPYISQALFLMYDKRSVSDEQAQTFEGLKAAAAAKGSTVKGVLATGTDGFNFSFPFLARNEETKATSVKIYETGSIREGTYVQGDDAVSWTKWMRDYRADPNGFGFPSDAGWTLDVQNGNALALIGGSWHYNSFSQAVGSENIGVAKIPTFTINDSQAFGTSTSGTVYRGGTFADVKVMMINSHSAGAKYASEQQLIKYLTSKEVQLECYAKTSCQPAYNTFASDIDSVKESYPEITDAQIALAKVQNEMASYGIPQPFLTATLNNNFYQKGAPAIYQAIIDNVDGSYSTDRAVQEGLFCLQYVWQNGAEYTGDVSALTLPIENTYHYGE